MIIVSDTSPITSLAAINRLNLLQQLYGNIIIPEAVYRELTEVSTPVPGTAEVKPIINALIQTAEFRVSGALYDRVLQIVGE